MSGINLLLWTLTLGIHWKYLFNKKVSGTKQGKRTTCHPDWATVDLLPAFVLDQISSVQNLGLFQRTVSSRDPSPQAA